MKGSCRDDWEGNSEGEDGKRTEGEFIHNILIPHSCTVTRTVNYAVIDCTVPVRPGPFLNLTSL